MAFDPIQFIRRRSREEWQGIFMEYWTDARIWIQENGEKAAVIALALGVALVLFYKIVLIVLALGVAVGCAGWNIALPAVDQKPAESVDPKAAERTSVTNRSDDSTQVQ